MAKRIINTPKAPAALGPYSQAIEVNGTLYISGQIPFVPETGYTFNDVVKATCFIKDMNDFAAVNEVYAEYLGEAKPARACVEVARLPKDVKVEIELIAVK